MATPRLSHMRKIRSLWYKRTATLFLQYRGILMRKKRRIFVLALAGIILLLSLHAVLSLLSTLFILVVDTYGLPHQVDFKPVVRKFWPRATGMRTLICAADMANHRAITEFQTTSRHDDWKELEGQSRTASDVTSRPFWKASGRQLEAAVRAADLLSAFVAVRQGGGRDEKTNAFFERFGPRLVSARQALALFHQYSGITGTTRAHIVLDKVHLALLDMQRLSAAAASHLLSLPHSQQWLRQSNTTATPAAPPFTPVQVQPAPHLPGTHTVISLCDSQPVQKVAVFNPLSRRVERVVSLIVSYSNVVLLDSSRRCQPAQLLPEWDFDSARPVGSVTHRHRLVWLAKAPPMGLAVYLLGRAKEFPRCRSAVPSEIELVDAPREFVCPKAYSCVAGREGEGRNEDLIAIENKWLRVDVYAATSLIDSVTLLPSDRTIPLKEDFSFYHTSASSREHNHMKDAALLAMAGKVSAPVVTAGGASFVSRGMIVAEIVSRFAFHYRHMVAEDEVAARTEAPHEVVSRVIRLYNTRSSQGHVIEVEHHVNMTHSRTTSSRELMVRYHTNTAGRSTPFFADFNPFHAATSLDDASSSPSLLPLAFAPSTLSLPVQANYFPSSSLAVLQQEEGLRFSVHSAQPHSEASLEPGSLEVMLDDCIEQWDEDMRDPGVPSPDSSRPTTATFHLLFETNTSAHHFRYSSPTMWPSLLSHHVSAHLNNPPLLFVQPSSRPCSEAEAVSAEAEEVKCNAARKWWFDFGGRGSRALSGCAEEKRGRAGVTVGELQQQVSLLSGKVPCDTDVLGISVHQPVESTENPSARLFTLLLQRTACDCSYGNLPNLDLSCSTKPNAWRNGVNLPSLFDSHVAQHLQEQQLTLEREMSANNSTRSDGGHLSEMGRIRLQPTEISAVKFTLG